MATVVPVKAITGRPIKQGPHLDQVEREMHRIGLGNFLGTDARKISEILDDDHDLLNSMGLTHVEISQRLEAITGLAKASLGEWFLLEGRYEVRAEEHRGMIPCPWNHSEGLFRKSYVMLEDRATGQRLIWSDLSIHLIREHGFYEGRGSPFRLDPEVLKQVFWGGS